MLELFNAAGRPTESTLGVSQVRHDEAVFPRTAGSSGTAEIGWRRRAVMYAAQSEFKSQKRQSNKNIWLIIGTTDGAHRTDCSGTESRDK